MNRVYEFATTLSGSDDYQNITMTWLTVERKAVVVDTRGTELDTLHGIDMQINGADAQFKADDKIDKTGNVVIELISNVGKGTIGCGIKHGAKWWLYLGTVSYALHVIDHHRLLAYIDTTNNSHIYTWRGFTTHTKSIYNEIAYATLGMLMPVKVIEKLLGVGYQKFDLAEYVKQQRQRDDENIPF